jgi:protein-disulfide isomerase
LVAAVAAACATAVLIVEGRKHTYRRSSPARVERKVAELLRGIPQYGDALGSPRAPVTLQIFGDLECLDVKNWFSALLPAIINELVRPNILRLEYRAMKTDTLNAKTFVVQQTAALAASRQTRMWDFLATFYYDQGPEYTNYVTEHFLDEIGRKVPGLDLEEWNDARVVSFAKMVVADDREARILGFHDTPAFRIGRTGGRLRKYAGRHIVIYRRSRRLVNRATGQALGPATQAGYMNPLSLIDARDIKNAIENEL